MLLKKDFLFKMIENKEINSCTIVGKPTKELQEVYFSNGDLMELFQKYNIENPLQEFDHTPISIYFPKTNRKQCSEICSITIGNEVLNEKNINKIIKNFLIESFDYYQISLPPYYIDKIVSNELLTFGDMLILIKDTRAEISMKIGKSPQLLCDMKNGRAKIGIETLALLKQEYPLLPWDEFIESFIIRNDRE
ncbi:XRE family transcriptional regulator [Clostridium botulinum]|uniref:XRE family transcriptional regulator n=1 Tax=Clostridium botulinum TaxID=1491 RepID=UPI001FA848C7|nr:XRE family transcriptional regulator [Clostridium botulinum]